MQKDPLDNDKVISTKLFVSVFFISCFVIPCSFSWAGSVSARTIVLPHHFPQLGNLISPSWLADTVLGREDNKTLMGLTD